MKTNLSSPASSSSRNSDFEKSFEHLLTDQGENQDIMKEIMALRLNTLKMPKGIEEVNQAW